jgi:hypothetical protein
MTIGASGTAGGKERGGLWKAPRPGTVSELRWRSVTVIES